MDSLMSHFDALKKKISEFNPDDLISDTATFLGNIQPSTIIDLNSLSENEHLPVIIAIVSLMIIFSLVKKTIKLAVMIGALVAIVYFYNLN